LVFTYENNKPKINCKTSDNMLIKNDFMHLEYRIAGKFGGKKVWRIQSSKDLAKESLVNGIVN